MILTLLRAALAVAVLIGGVTAILAGVQHRPSCIHYYTHSSQGDWHHVEARHLTPSKGMVTIRVHWQESDRDFGACVRDGSLTFYNGPHRSKARNVRILYGMHSYSCGRR
jgi:hypothetical protein